MKKLWTFFILAILFSVNIFAQSVVTIGTGTTTASGTNGTPIYRSSSTSSFHHSKSIQLLTASQLSSAGLFGGEMITGWAYNKQNNGAPSGSNAWTINVYLKNSTATSLVSGTAWNTMISGAVLGYTATITSANMPTALDYWNWPITGFTYNGGSIECYVEWFPSGTMTSPYTTNSFLWQYTTTTDVQAMGTSNSTAIAGTNASWTTQTRFYNTRITYTAGFACSGIPAPGNTLSSVTSACPNVNFNLTLQNPTMGSGVSFQWYKSPDNVTWSPIAGATSAGYTANQTVANWYKCDVTCSGSTGTSTPVNVGINSVANCYCTPTTGGGTTYYISNFTTTGGFTNINKTSAGSSTGYENFYSTNSMSTAPLSVINYTMTVAGGSTYGQAIWIDYNQDGTFQTTEQVVSSSSYISSPLTGSFTIPVTALAGTTRMRIIASYTPSNPSDPCYNSGTGEYEDYAITIGAPPSCLPPSALSATGITSNSAVLGWTEIGTATSWEIEWGPLNFVQGAGTTVIVTPTSSYTLNGLTSNTDYSFYVRTNCLANGYSSWSGPYSFKTLCQSVISFPWNETFATWPPSCWSLAGGTQNWAKDATSGAAYCNFWGWSTGNALMKSPMIDLTSVAMPYLKFKWSHLYDVSYPNDSLGIEVSNNSGSTWSTVWGKGSSNLNSNDGAGNTTAGTFVTETVNLSSYAGQSILIRFNGVSGYGPNVYVKDISVYSESNMAVTSSTTSMPVTAAIPLNSVNNIILRGRVVTSGSLNPLTITSFNFSTNGSTNAADIAKAKLWYSGSDSTGAALVLKDSVLNPNGNFIINLGTPITLTDGINFFWLTYDISGSATPNNVVDAELNSITIGGSSYIPTVTAPTGNRVLKAPLNGVYTIDNVLPASATNYNNFLDATNDLNILGISGPVTFNVTAGQVFPRTVGATPYNYAIAILTTGTPTSPIIFQKSGIGANPVFLVTGSAATNDVAIFNNGADYITFNGIDITGAGSSSADYLDYGYYFQGTATNGCSYNTVKNCNITLNNLNSNANGVFINSQATAVSGENNYNKFYNNTIKQACYGYKFVGKSGYYDIRNEIGTESGGSSVIRNLGNPSSITVQGIALSYQDSTQIFNTLIDTLTSTSTSAGGLCGIQVVSPISNFNIYNNTIRKIVGYETYGLNFGGASAGVNYFHHNIFTEMSSSVSGNLNVIRDEGSALGTCHIYNNEIYNISSTFGTIEGIYLNSASTFFIYNNKIRNLSTTATDKQVEGIALMNASNNSTVYNNLIYNLNAAASATVPAVAGIRVASTTTSKLYHNTIYLDYVSTNASNQSACVYAPATPTSLDMRNNILINKVDVTTGTRAVAFWWASTIYTNISASTNNNLYYAGVPSPKKLIFYNGVNSDSTLDQYKTRLATKAQSAKTEDVPFVSASFPYDLHIRTTVETQAESGGIVIPTFTTDFAGTPRFPNAGYPDNVIKPATAPDLGAYEFAGLTKDLTPPTVSFTDLANVSNLVSRTFTVNITDQGSVNVTTYKPRVYYKKTSGVNTFNDNTNATQGWKYVETTSTTSPFSFTLDYSKLYSAPVVGDTIQYFVVSQDNELTPNFGAYVATFTTIPTNVQLTAANFPVTGSIKQFKFVSPINGTILVGQGNPFNCLTCEGDTSVFKYINTNLLTGNLELVITSNLTETGFTALNQFAEEGAGNYTITIRPQSDVPDTIFGNYAGSLIRINGADRVTFDGRYNGNGNYLTIVNTNTSNKVFEFLTGSTYNTIRNCNIYNGGNTSPYAIYANALGVDNNSFINNKIKKSYYGIYLNSGTTGTYINNNLIEGNEIGSSLSSAEYVTFYGISVLNNNNLTVTGNYIHDMYYSTANYGIYIEASTNVVINKNIIHGIVYTGSGGYGSTGLTYKSSVANPNVVIKNNAISHIGGDSDTPNTSDLNYLPAGIKLFGTATSGIYLYYNSIYMTRDSLYGTKYSDNPNWSCALEIGAGVKGITMKNNILQNSLGKNYTMVNPAYGYAIYTKDPSVSPFASINHNVYFSSNYDQVYVGLVGTNQPPTGNKNLADWQAFTGGDANSVFANPMFGADTIAIKPEIGSPALSSGTPIAGVTTDITGKVRSNFTPTIGAYEVDALKTLNLTLFLEGLYNGAGGMNEAQDDMGTHWTAGVADKITVELHNSIVPSIADYTITNLDLLTNGNCTVTVPSNMNDSYYIVVKHRNSIATWSSFPISFTGTSISYNFSTGAAQAYGDNMKDKNGVYVFYVGDVNQDEVVDLSDLVDMDVDLTNGTVAYVVYDLNGDGVVDLSDLVAIDENLTNGVVSMYP